MTSKVSRIMIGKIGTSAALAFAGFILPPISMR